MNCNHTLGYWYGIESEVEFLYQDNIIHRIRETIEENMLFNEYIDGMQDKFGTFSGIKYRILNPLDYLDNRKNIIHKFNHCPYCGEKINWKEIKSKLK